jgi:Fe-S cluster biogenesis protein NfuA
MRNALGLQKPLTPIDPNTPLRLSASAQQWLSQQLDGQGLHVSTRAVEQGWTVGVTEGETLGPPPAELDPFPITIGNNDLHRLRGLILDRKHDRWCVTVEMDLRARETPNPNGRLYMGARWLALGRPMFFVGDADHPSPAAEILAFPGVESVLFRDNTLTVERAKDVPWDGIDRAVDAALREHFLRCGHELTAADLPQRDDPLEEEVWAVLEKTILPGIHADGGDLELIGIDQGVVRVAMHGACRGCPASSATLRLGVEKTLQDAFPNQIHSVEQV